MPLSVQSTFYWGVDFFSNCLILSLIRAETSYSSSIIAFSNASARFSIAELSSFVCFNFSKSELFELQRQYEPFADDDYNFAGRSPLQADLIYFNKNQNIPVSFDLNYREQLWSPQSAKSVFNEIIPYASMLKVGHDEAERIWANNWNPEEYARYFHGITGALVVITQNEKGAIAFDGTNLIESLGYKVSVVDPVGAGDAFTAGMLALILQQGGLKSFFELDTKVCEKLLSEAIDVGNICGALTCTKRGDTAAMPTLDEINFHLVSS